MASMCDGSDASSAWISLIDDLFSDLNRVRADDARLNVEFVLDGGVLVSPCLLQVCRFRITATLPAIGYSV